MAGDTADARGRSPSPDDAGEDAVAGKSDEVVQVPIEDSIDLHTFAPQDVVSVVDEYLHEARRKGFFEVRVIHGKGKGVQRAAVQRLLAAHPDVASFRDAPASRGGWGATVVRLRRRDPDPF